METRIIKSTENSDDLYVINQTTTVPTARRANTMQTMELVWISHRQNISYTKTKI